MNAFTRLVSNLPPPNRSTLTLAKRVKLLLICWALTVGVVRFDLLGSWHLPTATLYLIPILIVAWVDNYSIATLFAILSVVLWVVARITLAGAPFDALLLIDIFLRLAVYISFALCLAMLRYFQENLRALAEVRAQALVREGERSWQLERAMVNAEERERTRIGQDLHDGICQHLAATALAAKIVVDDLIAGQARTDDARRVLELIEEGIALTRGVAKDLYPFELRESSLVRALDELARKTKRITGVDCLFTCDLSISVADSTTAANLYRIAQESINNALRHGHATQIEILLGEAEDKIKLCICDNGSGLQSPLPENSGMGLRVMADRAKAIGGQFFLRPAMGRGTVATCVAPIR